MNLEEYNKVKNLNYLEYCDYLQNKYGLGKESYMDLSWNKNFKCSRTKEGLMAHHKMEDHAILLSDRAFAMRNPYEWQLPENLVYCDYLEHLFLHILICENPHKNKNKNEIVGIGGIINFLVPELNDFYSGWFTNKKWQIACFNKIKNDKNVYLELIKRFKTNCWTYPGYNESALYSSYNENFGTWKKYRNKPLFEELRRL